LDYLKKLQTQVNQAQQRISSPLEMSENITKLRKNASDLGLKGAETISED